jgi:GR25 family glycosyltransferase involved in LPS biosynthesis
MKISLPASAAGPCGPPSMTMDQSATPRSRRSRARHRSAFQDHFDRTVVISLPARADRRARLSANLRETGLAGHRDIVWQDAVDGRRAKLPAWWVQGPGGWGCRASHLETLRSAQLDGVERLLIIEDDACFHPRAAEWLAMLMPLLPPDWDMFFLGGQHMKDPAPTADARILRATCITRTHAYAIPRRAFPSLIAAVSNLKEYRKNPRWHIDHQFAWGHYHGRWKAYAPAWWLAGQDEGGSDIASASYDRRWWPTGKNYYQLPFVRYAAADSAAREWLYKAVPPPEGIPEDSMERSVWLRSVAIEAYHQGRLPVCDLSAREILSLWPGGLRMPASAEELRRLADYPANGLFPHPCSPQS